METGNCFLFLDRDVLGYLLYVFALSYKYKKAKKNQVGAATFAPQFFLSLSLCLLVLISDIWYQSKVLNHGKERRVKTT
jgi:hypothetical protein